MVQERLQIGLTLPETKPDEGKIADTTIELLHTALLDVRLATHLITNLWCRCTLLKAVCYVQNATDRIPFNKVFRICVSWKTRYSVQNFDAGLRAAAAPAAALQLQLVRVDSSSCIHSNL